VDGPLVGTIQSFGLFTSGLTESLSLNVLWTGLPAAMQAFLGTPTGTDLSTVNFDISGGSVVGASINIDPTPEPATLALLGSGLALLGGFIRRKDTNRLAA